MPRPPKPKAPVAPTPTTLDRVTARARDVAHSSDYASKPIYPKELAEAETRLHALDRADGITSRPPLTEDSTPTDPTAIPRAAQLLTLVPTASGEELDSLSPAAGDQLYAYFRVEQLRADPFWSPVIAGSDPIAAMYAYACLSGLPPLDAVLVAHGESGNSLSSLDLLAEAKRLHVLSAHVFRRAALSADIGPLWAARVLKSIANDPRNNPNYRITAVLAARAMSTQVTEVTQSQTVEQTFANANEEDQTKTVTTTTTERRMLLRQNVSSLIQESMRLMGGSGLQTPSVIDVEVVEEEEE